VNVQTFVFPLASVATLVTVVVPTWNVEPDAGVDTTFTFVQLSDRVIAKVTLLRLFCPALADKTIGLGQTMFGASVSLIVTVKLQLFVLPEPSVATQFTVVVPIGNVEPDGGIETTFTTPQLSNADTEKVTLLFEH
jgi:hypothetical protein